MSKKKLQKTVSNMFRKQIVLFLVLMPGINVLNNQLYAAPWRYTVDVSGVEEYSRISHAGGAADQKLVTEISPGFSVKRQGARIGVDGRYQFQQRFVVDNPNTINSNHNLRSALNAELWRKHLFVSATSNLSRRVTDPVGFLPLSQTSSDENQNDVLTNTINTRFNSKFSRWARVNASHTFNNTNQINSSSDTTSHTVNGVVANGPEFGRLSWSGTYNYSNGSAGQQDSVESQSALGRLGYRFTKGLTASLTVGYEVNPRLESDRNSTSGNNDSKNSKGYVKTGTIDWIASRKWHFNAVYGERSFGETYDFKVNWYPTVRTSIDAGYGKGPFGKTYNGSLNHKSRRSIWQIEYSESLTSRSFTNTLNALGVLTDENGDFILDETTGNPIIQQFEVDVVVDDTFVRKSLKGNVTFSGKKSTLKLGVGYERHIFENLNYVNKVYTASMSIMRNLTRRSDASLDFLRNRNTFGSQNQLDHVSTVTASYNHKLGKQTQVSSQVRYLRRDSNNKSVEQRDYLVRAQISITF